MGPNSTASDRLGLLHQPPGLRPAKNGDEAVAKHSQAQKRARCQAGKPGVSRRMYLLLAISLAPRRQGGPACCSCIDVRAKLRNDSTVNDKVGWVHGSASQLTHTIRFYRLSSSFDLTIGVSHSWLITILLSLRARHCRNGGVFHDYHGTRKLRMEQMPGPKEDRTSIFLLIHLYSLTGPCRTNVNAGSASAITIVDIKLTRSGTRTLVWP